LGGAFGVYGERGWRDGRVEGEEGAVEDVEGLEFILVSFVGRCGWDGYGFRGRIQV